MASGTVSGYCTNDRSTQPEFYCDWSSTPINNTQSSLTLNWRVYAPNSWYPYSYETNNFTYTLTLPNGSTYTDSISNHRIRFNTSSGSDWKYYLKDTHPASTTEAGYDWCGNYTGKQGYTFYSETFTITHKSDGTASVTIDTTLHPDAGTLRYGYIVNQTITLDNLVSACGAPGNVYIGATGTKTSDVSIPGNVTIRWASGQAGNNNAITKYRLFYKTGSAPTLSNYTGYFDTTNTSYMPNLTSRGATYYFKVQTIGTVSGYDSGISSAQATCLVNTAPSPPTISGSNQTITSGAAAVSTTVTAGAANGGASDRDVYYNTSNSHSGQSKLTLNGSYQGTLTFNPSQDGSITYYCWTWDGLEYSEVASRTITRNLKPSINAYTFTPTTYIAQNSAASTSTGGYVSSVSAISSCNKACTINIQLLYGSNTSPSNPINCADQTGKTTSSSIGSYNINNLLKNYYTGARLYFRLRIRATDSYESGDWIYSTVWSIAATPSTIATYDQFANSDIISGAGKCWNKIRVKYYEDASMTTRTVSAKAGNVTITATKSAESTADSGKIRYLDITLPDDIDGGAAITITVTLSDGNITKTFTATRTELETPPLGTLSMTLSTIDMYKTTSNIVLSCTAPCAFNNNLPVEASLYYISSMTANVASNTSGANSRNLTGYTATATASGATLSVSVPKTNFAQFGEFGKSTYNGTVTGQVRLTFTNKYGRTFTTGYKSYTINYNENATITSVTMQYKNGNTWTALGSNRLQEGLNVQVSVACSAYTNSTLTAKLYYKIGSGSYVLVDNGTVNVANGTGVQSKTITISFGQLPQITTADDWTWKVDLTSTATSFTSIVSVTTQVIKHIAPTITLNSLTGARTPSTGARTGASFTYELTLNTNYSNITNTSTSSTPYTTRTYRLNTASGSATSNTFTATSGTVADTGSDKAAWGQKSVKVYCTTTVVGLVTTTKTAYSNILTAYLVQPTIAYRTNYLGVNTETPDSDAVLDVRSAEGKEVIRLGNSSGGGKIEIGIVSGSIYIDII